MDSSLSKLKDILHGIKCSECGRDLNISTFEYFDRASNLGAVFCRQCLNR